MSHVHWLDRFGMVLAILALVVPYTIVSILRLQVTETSISEYLYTATTASFVISFAFMFLVRYQYRKRVITDPIEFGVTCDVCQQPVCHFNHHCMWTGVCISKDNVYAFIGFTVYVFAFCQTIAILFVQQVLSIVMWLNPASRWTPVCYYLLFVSALLFLAFHATWSISLLVQIYTSIFTVRVNRSTTEMHREFKTRLSELHKSVENKQH